MKKQKADMYNVNRFRLERERLGHIDGLKFEVIREWTAS